MKRVEKKIGQKNYISINNNIILIVFWKLELEVNVTPKQSPTNLVCS